MKTKLIVVILAIIILTIGYTGCASSTKTTKTNSGGEKETKTEQKIFVEDFDITPYKTEINLKEKQQIYLDSLKKTDLFSISEREISFIERVWISTFDLESTDCVLAYAYCRYGPESPSKEREVSGSKFIFLPFGL